MSAKDGTAITGELVRGDGARVDFAQAKTYAMTVLRDPKSSTTEKMLALIFLSAIGGESFV